MGEEVPIKTTASKKKEPIIEPDQKQSLDINKVIEMGIAFAPVLKSFAENNSKPNEKELANNQQMPDVAKFYKVLCDINTGLIEINLTVKDIAKDIKAIKKATKKSTKSPIE